MEYISLISIIALIIIIEKLKQNSYKWENVPGYKKEEHKEFYIYYWFNKGIYVSYVETYIYHNIYCKLKNYIINFQKK